MTHQVIQNNGKVKRTKNPVAKSLKNKEYKQTIINSKKIYSRKGEKNEIIKELQSSGTD
jgi:hypothetical protein